MTIFEFMNENPFLSLTMVIIICITLCFLGVVAAAIQNLKDERRLKLQTIILNTDEKGNQ